MVSLNCPSPCSSHSVLQQRTLPLPTPLPLPISPLLGFPPPPNPRRSAMAKTKQGKKDVDSYTIRGTNKVVRVGDCVLMRPSDSDNQPYVARVEKMEADGRGSVRVRVRWYYRPEESKGGRRQFHGAKELFLSDHFDLQSAHTIEGKCVVHSFKNYTKLDNVGPQDFFCRFEYKAATGSFTPDRVAVYCKCEMPYNPDDLMVQCDACKDWFHPSCMGMTIEQAKKLDHFVCSDCVKENGPKRLSNGYATSPNSEPKKLYWAAFACASQLLMYPKTIQLNSRISTDSSCIF
ncbi:chromatin remodeling protein EBS-like isoform X2 [Panicum virgatum]|nr:chromatin remodeling protein EBS-like isoform X2 [Panicum virgatum]